ncbi:CCR4-NOT core DEDD RNase subunit [Microbotryomycetes sp. JL201]|nr:CCR4-NOT core DEDD RNase subunit [Microbotryomycetes sp. JL201]
MAGPRPPGMPVGLQHAASTSNSNNVASGTGGASNGPSAQQQAAARIKDVWADNLEQEFAYIRAAIDQEPGYKFVAMDTEFPGVVARPIGSFKGSSDYHYQTLRCNVDLLRIIQLGLTLADENGQLAPGVCTWQFHFKFSVNDDMYAPESIDLLVKSGINFKRHEERGISVEHFGELLISSGLVLLNDVQWISFHSGYDFGYLLKIVSCAPLPPTEAEFFEVLKIWFPCVWDIKVRSNVASDSDSALTNPAFVPQYLMKSCKTLKGGLQEVADDLQASPLLDHVARIGPQHQAGSDSLLTSSTFFKMRAKFFENKIDPKYMNVLYGLNSGSSSNNSNSFSHPREHNGAVHYPTTGLTSSPAPLAQAASSAIAILSPSPKNNPAATKA